MLVSAPNVARCPEVRSTRPCGRTSRPRIQPCTVEPVVNRKRPRSVLRAFHCVRGEIRSRTYCPGVSLRPSRGFVRPSERRQHTQPTEFHNSADLHPRRVELRAKQSRYRRTQPIAGLNRVSRSEKLAFRVSTPLTLPTNVSVIPANFYYLLTTSNDGSIPSIQ